VRLAFALCLEVALSAPIACENADRKEGSGPEIQDLEFSIPIANAFGTILESGAKI
jgi:hypothetical protein